MTGLVDKGESVLAWVKTFAVLLLVGALLVLGWWALGEHRAKLTAQDETKRIAEAAQIETDGLTNTHELTKAQLKDLIAASVRDSAMFAAAFGDAQKKLRDAKAIAAMTASTGAVPVQHSATGAAPNVGAVPTCALTEADDGEIEVRSVTLETQAGNRVVVGSAEAFRHSPRKLLFGGSFAAPLTEAAEVAKPEERKPGWGAGGGPDLTPHGAGLRIAAASPEFKVPLFGGTAFVVPHAWYDGGDYGAGVIFIYRP